jgi:hypothetical protein
MGVDLTAHFGRIQVHGRRTCQQRPPSDPWQHRTWIFPRDPDFALKAGRIFDFYARRSDGPALERDECVISVDEDPMTRSAVERLDQAVE